MDVSLTTILNSLKEHGSGWGLIIIAVFVIAQVISIIGVSNMITFFKFVACKLKLKSKDKKLTLAKLYNHPLFFTQQHYINHQIKLMDFGDENRNKIFRSMLELTIKTMCDSNKELIRNNNLDNISADDFKAIVFRSFTESIDKYNLDIRDKLGKDVYDLVMQHPKKGFNTWNEVVIVYTRNLLEDICDSDLYSTNIERMYAVLNSLHSAIDAMVVNVEKTFKGFNGDLDSCMKAHPFN